jgi:hypothetical protein
MKHKKNVTSSAKDRPNLQEFNKKNINYFFLIVIILFVESKYEIKMGCFHKKKQRWRRFPIFSPS